MENIVNRILEIDKQARQLTMNAEDLQAKADVEIAQETKKIQADFVCMNFIIEYFNNG